MNSPLPQRWKNVRTVRTCPCYFFSCAVLIFYLFTRNVQIISCQINESFKKQATNLFPLNLRCLCANCTLSRITHLLCYFLPKFASVLLFTLFHLWRSLFPHLYLICHPKCKHFGENQKCSLGSKMGQEHKSCSKLCSFVILH